MGEIGPKRAGTGTKELKVENWAPYFLQRLYHMFSNSTHCDLTLRFSSSETLIKVHRLVLFACTDYFDSLTFENDSVDLEQTLTPEIVSLIVGFMYTGKIDIRPDTRDRLYDAALALRMPILTRLIDSHRRQETSNWRRPETTPQTPPRPPPARPTTVHAYGRPEPPPPVLSVIPAPTPQVEVLKPVVKNDVPSLPKRLSIWKRKVSMNSLGYPSRDDGKVRVVLSKPIPTRFEWEGQIGDEFPQSMVGESLRFMSHEANIDCPQPLILPGVDTVVPPSTSPALPILPPPPLKRQRKSEGADLTNMKEFGRQQQIRNELMMEEEDADDPVEMAPVSPPLPPKPILKPLTRPDSSESPKRVRFSVAQPKVTVTVSSVAAKTSPATVEPEAKTVDPLFVPVADVSAASVRVEPDPQQSVTIHPVGSATHVGGTATTLPSATTLPGITTGSSSLSGVTITAHSGGGTTGVQTGELLVRQANVLPPSETLKRVRYSVLSSDGTETVADHVPGSPAVGNPAKIVSEVLKKYPDLVSGRRKNIKLKVMTNNMAVPVSDSPSASKNGTGQVSYIVVKGAVGADGGDSDDLDPECQGPWRCSPCGVTAFPSYTEFRSHLVSVHQMKIDARICEFCGLKQQKRNHLLYHQYVKHGLTPPPPFSFPKCQQCHHVSLSANLLAKHVETVHANKDQLVCDVCNVFFKSQVLYGNHLHSDWHKARVSVDNNEYPCPFCDVEFPHAIQLKTHIEAMHQKKEIKENPAEEGIRVLNPCDSSPVQDSAQPCMAEFSSQPVPEASAESSELMAMQSLNVPAPAEVDCPVAEDRADVHEVKEAAHEKFMVCNVQSEEGSSFMVEPSADPPSADPLSQQNVEFQPVLEVSEHQVTYPSEQADSETPAPENTAPESASFVYQVENLQSDSGIEFDRTETTDPADPLASSQQAEAFPGESGNDLKENADYQSEPSSSDLYQSEPADSLQQNLVFQGDSADVQTYEPEVSDSSLQNTVYDSGTGQEVTYQPEQQTEEYAAQNGGSLVYSSGGERSDAELGYPVEGDQHTTGDANVAFETEESGIVAVAYENQGEVSDQPMPYQVEAEGSEQQSMVYESHPENEPETLPYETNPSSDQTEDFESGVPPSQGDTSYEQMELEEGVPTSEDMVTDTEEAPVEGDGEEEAVEEAEASEAQEERGDHDYPPYNSVVMFQPNMVLPQRVMLVTHPITHPLQVLLSGPNILPEQLVSIPYPQMQVVSSGQVVTTTGQVVTTTVPTECPQVARERKVEPEALVNDWDESSQAEPTPPVTLPGGGPSRPDFF